MLYHPDSAGDVSNEMSQRINAAYEYLKTHPNEAGIDESDDAWQAAVNENAFCERTVFVDYRFLDDRIPIRSVAEGRYLWDPYLEDFSMLSKSVAIAAVDIMGEYGCGGDRAELFHLLMQEFVEPIDCARKIGRAVKETKEADVYEFSGEAGISDRRLISGIQSAAETIPLYGIERNHRIRLCDRDGVIYGDLSYEDDSFYYVVSPLIADPPDGVKVKLYSETLHTDRRDLKFSGKLDVRIIVSIEKRVSGRMTCNAGRIERMLMN